MAITKVTTVTTGLVDTGASIIYIDTTDTINTVSQRGFLNPIVQSGTNLSKNQIALVNTTDGGAQFYFIRKNEGDYSLINSSLLDLQIVTASTVQMGANQKYMSRKSGGNQTFLLPVNPSIGDSVSIIGSRTCSWSIPTGSPRYIVDGENFFNTQCTSGSSNGNCIEIICIDPVGGWNVVAQPPAGLSQ